MQWSCICNATEEFVLPNSRGQIPSDFLSLLDNLTCLLCASNVFFVWTSEPKLSLCCLQGKSKSETEQSPDSGTRRVSEGLEGRSVVEGSSAFLTYALDYQGSVHSNIDSP